MEKYLKQKHPQISDENPIYGKSQAFGGVFLCIAYGCK